MVPANPKIPAEYSTGPTFRLLLPIGVGKTSCYALGATLRGGKYQLSRQPLPCSGPSKTFLPDVWQSLCESRILYSNHTLQAQLSNAHYQTT